VNASLDPPSLRNLVLTTIFSLDSDDGEVQIILSRSATRTKINTALGAKIVSGTVNKNKGAAKEEELTRRNQTVFRSG